MLLQDDEVFWGRLRSYLVGVNADVVAVHGPGEITRAVEKGPDLLVTGRGFLSHPEVRGLRIPSIVVDDADGGALPDVGSLRSATVLRWPFPKRTLLEATAAALNLEPRREFRTLMRVGIAGEKPGTMAESRDFSSSGLSFSSTGYFGPASRVAVSISLPGEAGSVVLEGRVVRTFKEADGVSTFHGVQFVEQDAGTTSRLRDFLLS